MLTDPIADMLTRIRNANKALQDTVEMPTSRVKVDIARLLKEEATSATTTSRAGKADTLVVELRFGRNRERIITDLKRVSKPGRRIYARKDRSAGARWDGGRRSCRRPQASSPAGRRRSAASAERSFASVW